MDVDCEDYESLRRQLQAARARIAELEAAGQPHVQQALRQSEQRHRSLFEHNPVGVVAFDRDGRMLSANPAAQQISGYSEQELRSLRFADLCAPEDLATAWGHFQDSLAGRTEPREMGLIRKDGRRVELRVIGVPIVEDGQLIGMYGLSEDVTARRQAEQFLRDSEARFRDVLDHSLDVVYRRNLQTDRMDYLSPAIEQVTGLTVEQATGMNFDAILDRVHPEDRAAIHAAFAAGLTAGEGQIVFRFRHVSGQYRWLVDYFTMRKNAAGQPLYRTGVIRDVTQYRQHREALAASDQRYRDLFNGMTEGFALYEVVREENGQPCDARFLEVNPVFERLAGLKRQDMVGRLLSQVLPNYDPTWLRIYGQVALTGQSMNFEYYSTALQRHLGVFAYCPAPGQVAVLSVDISDRKQAEEALSHSHRQLQDVIDGAPAFVAIKNLAGQFVTVNRQMERAYGVTREQLRGRTDHDLVPAELADAYRRHDAQALAAGHPVQVEEVAVLPDGQEQVCLASKFPLFDPEGHPYAVCVISVDITQRKKVERQLQALNETLEQRVAERTALAEERATQLRVLAVQLTRAEQQERRRIAHLLHEHFQQLLVTVKHRLDRVRSHMQDAPLAEEIQQAESILAEAIQASRSLTVELYPPVLYDMGLAAGLHWLGRWMRDHHGLTVAVQADPKADPSAEEISVLLFEAVRELLLNVLKHAKTQQAVVEMRLAGAGQTCIVVADQGSGFDRSQADSSKGFGLFGIQHRLGLLGGTTEVHSTPGQGTRVMLVSPQRAHTTEPSA